MFSPLEMTACYVENLLKIPVDRTFTNHYMLSKQVNANWNFTVRGKKEVMIWGQEVISRDLHAADAVYHQSCSISFRKGRAKPADATEFKKRKTSSVGRPKKPEFEEAFRKVINYL